jgi:dipeptidyl-peptidase 4
MQRTQLLGMQAFSSLVASGLILFGAVSPALGQPVAPVAPPSGPAPTKAGAGTLAGSLLTTAEESNWQATTTSPRVVELLDAIAAKSPSLARRVSMGTTFEGREMPVIVLSDPPVATATEARALADKEQRAIVLLFGNIHGGEVDAKEAYVMLARELALRDHAGRGADFDDLLKHLIICIAPNYNADGNDKVGAIEITRPGQNGPIDGAGTRHNAMDRDLNRDWGKLETPEGRNLVRFIDEWNPHVIVDGHTSNGSWIRYLMTYAGPKVPAGDAELIRWTRDQFFPEFDREMAANHSIDTFFYGDFAGHYTPPATAQDGTAPAARVHTKWETFPAQARYSTGYLGLRGRIGILSESYAYSTFYDRIVGSRALALEVLRLASKHRAKIRELVAAADLDGAGKGPTAGRPIAIRGVAATAPEKAMVKGYVEEQRGGRWVATGEARDYECEVWNRYEGTRTVKRPLAYAFTQAVPEAIENLKMHGIKVEILDAAKTVSAEVYTIDHVSNVSRIWQGHMLVSVEATPATRSIELPAGTVIVRTDQPLGTLAVYQLEPECEDGLTTWNFFDAFLAPGEEFPVVRVVGW